MSEAASSAAKSERRALLLDFDGTLANTLPDLRSVYGDFLKRIDAVDKAPSFAEVNGANLFELITALCRQFAPEREAAEEWRGYWAQIEGAVLNSAPADGAARIIAWAQQQGWLIGIGSASRSALIGEWLAQNSLASSIDCVVGADLCHRSKPDPEIYQRLMTSLGVTQASCLVIEDSAAGLESARNAGLDVILLSDQKSPVGNQDTACHIASDLVAALAYLQQRFEPRRAS